jgi:uncharacterized protein (DUF1697 family)
MADLRSTLESLGYTNVRTLLNSGNAVFSHPRPLVKNAPALMQDALLERTGVSSRFLVLSAEQLELVYAGNPFGAEASDPSRFFAGFLYDPADVATLRDVLRRSWKPERVATGPGVVYVWCPNGLSQSVVYEVIAKALGDGITTRNWATVTKILAMAGA